MDDEPRLALSRELARDRSGRSWPLNGMHEQPFGDMSGWFLWTGEIFPTADDAFVPLHALHAEQYVPHALPYLTLGVGWRFLIAPDQEDVWFDPALLTPQE